MKKNKLCKTNDIQLIRIRENGLDALENCYCILRKDSKDSSLKKAIYNALKYIGISNPDINLKRDRFDIYSLIELSDKENSLLTKYPKIASEWNYEKNESIPSDYLPHSQHKVWWKCSKGHEYEAKIGNRTSLNRGCPFCYGRYPVVGENDFGTLYPNLAKLWDYEKNEKRPEDFLSHSQKKIWWECSNGHSYEKILSSQVLQNGKCPYCK